VAVNAFIYEVSPEDKQTLSKHERIAINSILMNNS